MAVIAALAFAAPAADASSAPPPLGTAGDGRPAADATPSLQFESLSSPAGSAVCFGPVPGYTTPGCQSATVETGSTVEVTGTYES